MYIYEYLPFRDTANISITIPLLGQTFSMLIKLTVDALQSMRDEGHHRTSISLAPLPADTDKVRDAPCHFSMSVQVRRGDFM